MQRWEYRAQTMKFVEGEGRWEVLGDDGWAPLCEDNSVARLGLEGWELVSSFVLAWEKQQGGRRPQNPIVQHQFKRPLGEA